MNLFSKWKKHLIIFLHIIGFDTEGLGPTIFRGGETEALARLERHLERKVLYHSELILLKSKVKKYHFDLIWFNCVI